jgi:hypothetical protein
MWTKSTYIRLKKLGFFAAVIAIALLPVLNISQQAYADTATQLYITDNQSNLNSNQQTVTSGGTLTLYIMVDTGDDSINEVQTDFTYPTQYFSSAAITYDTSTFPSQAGPGVGGTPLQSAGSIEFNSYTTGSVSGTELVATVVLTVASGITSASSPQAIDLGTVCAGGDFSDPTCSLAYDSTTSDNDLGAVNNYTATIDPVTTTPAATTPSASTNSGSTVKTPDTGLALTAANAANTVVLSIFSAFTLVVIALRLKPARHKDK